jgi:hypothetical protein
MASFCLDGSALAKRYSQALVELESEVIRSPAKHLLLRQCRRHRCIRYIMTHSINATDAIILRVSTSVTASERWSIALAQYSPPNPPPTITTR